TGFAEPEAVLVLVPGRKHGECLLFCRERDAAKEAWDGPRVGQDGAISELGMDDAYPISDLDDILPGLLEGRTRVYYHFGRDTDLLLVDAGAEYRNYASDITRTWPVNGRYSKEQRVLYEIVLAAQQAALAQARPGKTWIAGHEAAVEVLTEGLLSLGLLKGS